MNNTTTWILPNGMIEFTNQYIHPRTTERYLTEITIISSEHVNYNNDNDNNNNNNNNSSFYYAMSIICFCFFLLFYFIANGKK
jgi:hypothetical protein